MEDNSEENSRKPKNGKFDSTMASEHESVSDDDTTVIVNRTTGANEKEEESDESTNEENPDKVNEKEKSTSKSESLGKTNEEGKSKTTVESESLNKVNETEKSGTTVKSKSLEKTKEKQAKSTENLEKAKAESSDGLNQKDKTQRTVKSESLDKTNEKEKPGTTIKSESLKGTNDKEEDKLTENLETTKKEEKSKTTVKSESSEKLKVEKEAKPTESFEKSKTSVKSKSSETTVGNNKSKTMLKSESLEKNNEEEAKSTQSLDSTKNDEKFKTTVKSESSEKPQYGNEAESTESSKKSRTTVKSESLEKTNEEEQVNAEEEGTSKATVKPVILEETSGMEKSESLEESIGGEETKSGTPLKVESLLKTTGKSKEKSTERLQESTATVKSESLEKTNEEEQVNAEEEETSKATVKPVILEEASGIEKSESLEKSIDREKTKSGTPLKSESLQITTDESKKKTTGSSRKSKATVKSESLRKTKEETPNKATKSLEKLTDKEKTSSKLKITTDKEKVPDNFINITEDSNIFKDIPAFYTEKTFSDVVLVLDEERIPAHKMILAARSKYFETVLATDPEKAEIVITDVPPEAFKKILKYIYSGYISLDPSDIDTIFEVIDLAGRYSLKGLDIALSQKLSTYINMNNVFKILNKATFHEMEELKNTCLVFMDSNSSKILHSCRLNDLSQKSMVALLERDSFIEPEIEIFKAVARWCWVNKDDGNLVMQTVRLDCLTVQEILTVVEPTKLVDGEKIISLLAEGMYGIPEKAKPRIPTSNQKDENLCSTKFKPEFISGSGVGILLSHSGHYESEYAYHNVGEPNGITLKFRTIYHVNHIFMHLWDEESSDYFSYYVEVSEDKTKWQTVIDYSTYHCRSIQNIYFDKIGVKYIRVVGTFSSVANEFRLTYFKAYLRDTIPEMTDGIIHPKQNVSLAVKGAVVLAPKNTDGSEDLLTTSPTRHLVLNFHQECVVRLAQPYIISNMNLSLFASGYQFLIATSINGTCWQIAVDHRCFYCDRSSFSFEARPTSYVKIVGFDHSWSKAFACNCLECYWTGEHE